jgi:hypothetical protein
MPSVYDRIWETTSTTGTGTISLQGARQGHLPFSTVGDGFTTWYCITDGTNWEVGQGTYTASGNQLSRDTVYASSAGGSSINFAAGTKDVFQPVPASRVLTTVNLGRSNTTPTQSETLLPGCESVIVGDDFPLTLNSGVNLTLSATSAVKMLPQAPNLLGFGPQNFLINGTFRFAQRQTPGSATSYADGTYGADRWFQIGNSGATDIVYERIAGLNNYSSYGGWVYNNNASAKYVGQAQVIESTNAAFLRGKQVVLQFIAEATASSSNNLRAAILEWNGAANTLGFTGGTGRSPVNSWTSTNYTSTGSGAFFQNAAYVNAVSPSLTGGTTVTQYSLTGTVSNACNNLIVMIWTESAPANGFGFKIQQAGLFVGNTLQPWIPRLEQHELALCQRYYQKSYPVDVLPGTAGQSGLITSCYASATANSIVFNATFPVHMRTTPNMRNWSYDGTASSAYTSGTGLNVTTALQYNTEFGAGWYNNGTPNVASGNIYTTNYDADAEI